ncbi:MAG TPA: potassium channel family protein, partial [Pyrinomonadaceae bacterium]
MMTRISFAAVIVFGCLLLHVAGMMAMAEWVFNRREYLEAGSKSRYSIVLILLFSGIIVLHVTETGLWALFYYSRSLFETFETALYFSLGSYTTIGYGDVVLPQRWRLLGAIEGISGVLLCGISTAFIFAVINAMFQRRFSIKQQSPLAVREPSKST